MVKENGANGGLIKGWRREVTSALGVLEVQSINTMVISIQWFDWGSRSGMVGYSCKLGWLLQLLECCRLEKSPSDLRASLVEPLNL